MPDASATAEYLGWSGPDAAIRRCHARNGYERQRMTNQEPHDGEGTDRRSVVEVLEETSTLNIRKTVLGRVRISTRTEAVKDVLLEELESIRAEVVRVPIERTLDPDEALPVIRIEGNVTIVPVLEEILVVERRMHLREEVHVTSCTTREDVEVPVARRRQQAVIERVREEPDPASKNSRME